MTDVNLSPDEQLSSLARMKADADRNAEMWRVFAGERVKEIISLRGLLREMLPPLERLHAYCEEGDAVNFDHEWWERDAARYAALILAAPFPWFGGKRQVAALAWQRFGDVQNYVEPFAGSLAVLLGRPLPFSGPETVNDRDGFIANFWRALQADPEGVAEAADWPVNENDQHARHAWLVRERSTLTARLEGDPEFFDAKIAGWWVWGICCWIGAGWCSGDGPWSVDEGQLVHLGNAGRGVHRQLVHLGNAGKGIRGGQGEDGLFDWMLALAGRLRRVRVCCGDWSRVCGPTPTVKQGLTAVLLDPPYADDTRTSDLYAVDDGTLGGAVRAWALEWGADPRMRIALCGYQGEHATPDDWTAVPWKAHGGYGSQGNGTGRENADREVIWFSPHCLKRPTAKQELLAL